MYVPAWLMMSIIIIGLDDTTVFLPHLQYIIVW